jgi:hypothetical protein
MHFFLMFSDIIHIKIEKKLEHFFKKNENLAKIIYWLCEDKRMKLSLGWMTAYNILP